MAILALVSILVAKKNAKIKKRKFSDSFNLKRRGKGNVDSVFLKRILKMLKLVFTSWKDPILIDFGLLNLTLVVRTLLSKILSIFVILRFWSSEYFS